MPEIKNTIKTQSEKPQSPKSKDLSVLVPVNPKFELPNRKFNFWTLIIPLLLAAALVGGWFLHELVFPETAPEPIVVTDEKPDKPAVNIGAYYLTANNEGKVARVYGYTGNSAAPDIKVADIDTNTVSILGKYTEPHTYLAAIGGKSDIYILDAVTGKTDVLVKNDGEGYLRQAAISNDKKWLAYGLTYEGDTPTSDLWLFNLETKERKELIEKTPQQTYQGYAVLGWRNDDQELIVSALGGDAGAVWGDIYQVNVTTGTAAKVTPVPTAAMNYFIRGTLSPNGNLWAYTFCQTPDKTDGEPVPAASEPCTTGAEIRTYDFTTKQTQTVFHNLRFETNNDKNLLRSVLSMLWQDDRTLVAAIPGAVIEIDATAKDKVTDLFTFDRYNPQNFQTSYVGLLAASPAQIVFTRDEEPQVYDRVSKKTEVLNIGDRGEIFSAWLN